MYLLHSFLNLCTLLHPVSMVTQWHNLTKADLLHNGQDSVTEADVQEYHKDYAVRAFYDTGFSSFKSFTFHWVPQLPGQQEGNALEALGQNNVLLPHDESRVHGYVS